MFQDTKLWASNIVAIVSGKSTTGCDGQVFTNCRPYNVYTYKDWDWDNWLLPVSDDNKSVGS